MMFALPQRVPPWFVRKGQLSGDWILAVDYASLSAILSSVASVGKIIETTLALVAVGKELTFLL